MSNPVLVYDTLQSAARAAAAEGHPTESEAIFRRAAGFVQRKLGRDTEEFAVCMRELGDLLSERHLWHAAEECYRDALSCYSARLPASKATLALVMRNLSDVLRQIGSDSEARELEHKAAVVLASRFAN